MKRAFAMFGLLGLVGCFLPLVPGFSLFDARQFDFTGVFLVIAAFGLPFVLGFTDKLHPGAAIVAIGCFAYVLLYKFGFDVLDLIWHGSIGGKAMGVAAIGGLLTSIGSLTETKKS
jgi:hypothetical protein